jgi:hypothetical protein
MRRVHEIIRDPIIRDRRAQGAFLKLSCGHWNWEAGFTDRDFENIIHFSVERACLGGCYQYQRAMGPDC